MAQDSVMKPPPILEGDAVSSEPNGYDEWAEVMKIEMDAHGLAFYTRGITHRPGNGLKELETNAKAFRYILSALKDKTILADIDLASIAWLVVEATYGCKVCHRFQRKAIPRTPPVRDTGCGIGFALAKYSTSAKYGCAYCQLLVKALNISVPDHDERWTNLALTDVSPASEIGELQCSRLSIRINDLVEKTLEFFTLRVNFDKPLQALKSERESLILDFVSDAKHWLKVCREGHDLCRTADPEFIPRRLLEIPTTASASDIHLVDRATLLGHPFLGEQLLAYAALSYCGSPREGVITTTKGNVGMHLERISESSLPQTLRDAIAVCRHLEIAYLWVDSLCIIQDSSNDEDRYANIREATQIYSNAALVLAADVSPYAGHGLLSSPDHIEHAWEPLEVPATDHSAQLSGAVMQRGHYKHRIAKTAFPIPALVLAASPLAKRAWALQESILANRALHFTDLGMIWECNEKLENEEHFRMFLGSTAQINAVLSMSRIFRSAKIAKAYPDVAPHLPSHTKSAKSGTDEESKLPRTDYLAEDVTVPALYHAWREAVVNYSHRELTDTSDKLTAISGLASLVVDSLQLNSDDYLAGLWRHDLAQGLLWRVSRAASPPRRPLQYRAPSWSWAALDSAVAYFQQANHFTFRSWMTVVKAGCQSSLLDLTGRVTDGCIEVSGELQPVLLDIKDKIEEKCPSQYTRKFDCRAHTHDDYYAWVSALQGSGYYRYEVLLDVAGEFGYGKYGEEESNLYCLNVGEHIDLRTGRSRAWWLVLREVEGKKDTFTRVGIGWFHVHTRDFTLFEGVESTRCLLV